MAAGGLALVAAKIESSATVMSFDEWCEITADVVKGHRLTLLVMTEGGFATANKAVAGIVPAHYAGPERIAEILAKFGKQRAAAFLRTRLPQGRRSRSGELGEILATAYIDERSEYSVPVKRLRWKDHREMPMRGDDVIAVAWPEQGALLRFLKGEVKSRKSLSANPLEEAREALDKDNGLPSPHALAFIADRLNESGQIEHADQIVRAQLQDGISDAQVQHLIFTFSGNAPDELLRSSLEEYVGTFRQDVVGLRVEMHSDFIAAVYDMVDAAHES